MIYALIVGLLAALAGGIAGMKYAKIGPFKPKLDELEDFYDHPQWPPDPIPPPQDPVPAPIQPPAPISPNKPNMPEVLQWDTPKAAYHSTRVLCDEMGATYEQKNRICGMVYQESRFLKGAIGKPNKNGTRDYGIAQFNNGTLRGVPLWIGKGATFASTDEVLNNPEKCMRVMIRTCLAGHWSWWMSFSEGTYEQWLAPSSPMWTLA